MSASLFLFKFNVNLVMFTTINIYETIVSVVCCVPTMLLTRNDNAKKNHSTHLYTANENHTVRELPVINIVINK